MKIAPSMEISFSASGWLFIYQLGVARVLQMSNLTQATRDIRITGSSGGALVGAALIVNADLIQLKDYLLDCVDDCKKHPSHSFKLREYVVGAFNKVKSKRGNFFDAHLVQQGKLGVSVTTLPNMQNHIITDFESQEEIEQAILASCTITPLAGLPFQIHRERDSSLHGQWVIDGGLSNIQPHICNVDDDDTDLLTVAAFSKWNVDIKPSLDIPYRWGLHPPSREEMAALFDLGMFDALEYLKQHQHRFPTVSVPTTHLSLPISMDVLRRSERNHTISDKAVEISYRTVFKGMAFCSVYLEQTHLAAYNLCKGLIIALEKNRRQLVGPSKSIFSIRRWLPSIGSCRQNMKNSLGNVKNLMSVQRIWSDLEVQKQEFIKNSSFIKYFG